MKKIYLASWLLSATIFSALVFTDSFNAISLVGFSLTVLVLVYAMAIWTVFVNTNNSRPENYSKI